VIFGVFRGVLTAWSASSGVKTALKMVAEEWDIWRL